MGVMTLMVVAVAVAVIVLAARIVPTWWRYRGARVIICPENQRAAGITVAAGRVAARSIASQPRLELSSCSRWPEKAGCGQECLHQVEDAPGDCLVRNILVQWYAGKKCAACGQSFGTIPLTGARPAVLRADMISVDWADIPAELLPATLASSTPICFACHMGNTLVHQHPELAIDRGRTADKRIRSLGTE